MPKPSRGLPKDFQLNVPNSPVDLGDYLDEQPPAARGTGAGKADVIAPLTAIDSAVSSSSSHVNESPTTDSQPSVSRLPQPLSESRSARPGGPPRKQFNMTTETLKMVDDLLIHIRNHSIERDVRASELFHALVLAVHDVRPLLDLSRVPARGRWGSPTAAALPVAMKEAFQDAIARAKSRR